MYISNKNIDGVKQKILSLIPKYSIFIEAFAGGAGIGKNIYTSDKNIILIEKNKNQANILKELLPGPVHRVNGKNVCPKFDNLSLKQRQSYPIPFCHKLLNYIQCN